MLGVDEGEVNASRIRHHQTEAIHDFQRPFSPHSVLLAVAFNMIARIHCSFAYSNLACSRCRLKTPVSIIFDSSNNPQCTEHAKSDDEEEQHRFRNGEDLRYLPLTDRKLRLHAVVPRQSERLLYCDHIDRDGEGLFRLACEHDLEGIVAKRKSDPYLPDHATWLKIRNSTYSQWIGRAKLFERERGVDPDVRNVGRVRGGVCRSI
jgi:hypothetical protein